MLCKELLQPGCDSVHPLSTNSDFQSAHAKATTVAPGRYNMVNIKRYIKSNTQTKNAVKENGLRKQIITFSAKSYWNKTEIIWAFEK